MVFSSVQWKQEEDHQLGESALTRLSLVTYIYSITSKSIEDDKPWKAKQTDNCNRQTYTTMVFFTTVDEVSNVELDANRGIKYENFDIAHEMLIGTSLGTNEEADNLFDNDEREDEDKEEKGGGEQGTGVTEELGDKVSATEIDLADFDGE